VSPFGGFAQWERDDAGSEWVSVIEVIGQIACTERWQIGVSWYRTCLILCVPDVALKKRYESDK
jgi:hypothetical protein